MSLLMQPDDLGALADRIVEAHQRQLTATDFYAYMPMHQYIFVPTGELWPASSVNRRLKINGEKRATDFLDAERAVEVMTWAPGLSSVIEDQLASHGGWIRRPGCRTFNLYRPPSPIVGDSGEIGPWLEHLTRLCGADADHVLMWMAQRVQQPQVKINHALVLGGDQGIGKDTLLDPLRLAVGPWNFNEVSPAQVMGRFNGFLKSVVLRVSEVRDMGDHDRYALYEHLKALLASPPEVLRCDEKNVREYSVFNVMGVVFTTNHRDGLYLPADDRRHFVVWCDLPRAEFEGGYFHRLHAWYAAGGANNVAKFLQAVDITDFDPKAPPPKTEAWRAMVNAGLAPEDADLAAVLEACGRPDAITLARLVDSAQAANLQDAVFLLTDRKVRRAVRHHLERAGYVPALNGADARDGQWRIDGKRQTVYARRDFTPAERMAAARRLAL